ncbi:MerR family transcriptional regulator [Xylanimonas oleitrophica]|uniref:MerR family transcriptional regulator n=1 Tax=Xylanimonas oleitrophica TaxID=2607479 RepID=UPI001C54F67E|nr:MerR family transcriptional regulator [Xylanimonas oleitrophica]
MPWSTRRLADLAGVSLRTVRHYHDMGLLPEPVRRSNGYKEYDVSHLVTVLRIRRMSTLGFSLEQIGAMLDAPHDADAVLRDLDAELEATIARLQRARTEIAALRRLDVTPDIGVQTHTLMDTLGHDRYSRDVAVVLTHVLPEQDLDLAAAVMADAARELGDLHDEFAALDGDSSIEEIAALASRVVEEIGALVAARPELAEAPAPSRAHLTEALLEAVNAGLNPAQTAVLNLAMSRLPG